MNWHSLGDSPGAMAFSVVTGPINFGAAPSGQAGARASDSDPFMEQLSLNASVGDELEAQHTHVQPPGSWPEIAVSGLGETISKGQASNSKREELTFVTQVGQPLDRQLQAPEVHEASDALKEDAHSSFSGHTTMPSNQHATDVTLEHASADSAEPTRPELASAEQNAFQGSGSRDTVPMSAGAADAAYREHPSSSRTLQQHEQAAARARAIPLGSADTNKAQQVDRASEQHQQQEEASLPGLQPVVPDQETSRASLVHLALEGKGPANADHLHSSEQPGRILSAKPAAHAGPACIPHITASGSASAQQSTVLQSEAGVVQCTEQQASPGSSPARHGAGVPLKEREGLDQHPGNTSDIMSAAPDCTGGPGSRDSHDIAELNECNSAVSTIRPAAAAIGPAASSHGLRHPADPAVPSASASADASADGASQSQASDQQRGTSLPAHSSVPAARGGKDRAPSQLHSADETSTSRNTELALDSHEAEQVSAEKISLSGVVSWSEAQPLCSGNPLRTPGDADVHGSPQEKPMAVEALQTASADATHAAGTEHRQPEPEPVVEHMAASTPRSDAMQAGNDSATTSAEPDSGTQEELLALADAVTRLEVELADAREAIARHESEAENARQEAAQWQDREADARAQMVAVREAYADMRSTAEAAQAQLSELQAAEVGLQKQLSTCAQQARASEESKMRSRLDRAERAIEQERAAVRDLQAALQACRQSGVAQDDGSTGKMAAELAALKRDLAEASAALAAQKATNKGLQIRVAELLKGSFNAAALQETYVQVKQERDTLLASKHQWTTNETLLSSLKAQNNALHVTTEKLVTTNSELMERLNRQSEQVQALQDALAMAQAAQVPRKAEPNQQTPGGTRITETELELMALAEYVQQLEGKLAKQQADSAGHQGAQDSHTGLAKEGAPCLSLNSPSKLGHDTVKQLVADGHVQEEVASINESEKICASQPSDTVQDSKLVGQAGASTKGSADADVFSDEQVSAIKAALRPKSVQQGQQKQQSKGFWGHITDYITGADKLIQ